MNGRRGILTDRKDLQGALINVYISSPTSIAPNSFPLKSHTIARKGSYLRKLASLHCAQASLGARD